MEASREGWRCRRWEGMEGEGMEVEASDGSIEGWRWWRGMGGGMNNTVREMGKGGEESGREI